MACPEQDQPPMKLDWEHIPAGFKIVRNPTAQHYLGPPLGSVSPTILLYAGLAVRRRDHPAA